MGMGLVEKGNEVYFCIPRGKQKRHWFKNFLSYQEGGEGFTIYERSEYIVKQVRGYLILSLKLYKQNTLQKVILLYILYTNISIERIIIHLLVILLLLELGYTLSYYSKFHYIKDYI